MATITFDRINNELHQIVTEFEQLLDDGKYDEAKDVVDQIAFELNANTDIELDQISSDYDNNFHEIYSLLTEKVNDRQSAHVATVQTLDYDGLKHALEFAVDKVFKTAEIRKELMEKDPDQDAYKDALEEGITEATADKDKLQKEKDKYDFIEHEIYFDASGVDRRTLINPNDMASLEHQYEEIRMQLEKVKKGIITYKDPDGNIISLSFDEVFRNMPDMGTIDVTTDAGKAALETAMNELKSTMDKITDEISIKDQEIEIFNDHINLIEVEKEILAKDPDDRESYINNFDQATKDKIDAEKQMRHDDCRAKTMGDKEKAREYRERWQRFQSHRKDDAQDIITDSNGQNIQYTYEYIEDYPEKEEDIEFMQLESWEERAKRCAQFQATDKDIEAVYGSLFERRMKKLQEELAEMNNTYGTYTQDQIDDKNAEIDALKAEMKDLARRDVDYVKNYNSSHFSAKDSVAILRTGGSAMMVKNNNRARTTFADRAQAFFKWTSFKPKEDGKRHVIRTAVSNIGGVVSLPIRLVETGIGNVAALGQYVYAKATKTYDMPTPYRVGYTARKEARQAYYLENGSTSFGAWLKSWSRHTKDENGNRINLDEKLIENRCKEIDISIEDKYIRFAREDLLIKAEEAKRNDKARKAAYRNESKTSELYEDIYEFSDKISTDKTSKKVMQKVALGMGGNGKAPINDRSQTYARSDDDRESTKMKAHKRSNKFKQTNPGELVDNMDMNLSSGYDFNGTIGDTIWTNSVTREQIGKAMTKNRDRALKVAAAATIAGARYFLTRPTMVDNTNIELGEEPTAYIQKPKTKTEYLPTTKQVDTAITYDNATIGDCIRGDKAHWCADLDAYTAHPAGTFSANDNVVQGINFKFTDINGNRISYSIGDMNIKNYIDTHPNCTEFSNAYGNLNIDTSTPISKLSELLPEDIKQKYVEALNASGDKLSFSNNATQIAWGDGTGMARGWSGSDVPIGATKVVTTTVNQPVTKIIGYDWEKVTAAGPRNMIITHTPGRTLSKSSKIYDLGNGITIAGLTGMVAQTVQQGLFPTFRNNHNKTINKHNQTYNNGKPKITEEDVYDMWDR